ncbi:DUF3987 domain-containing protein [Desulfurivibrio sp. D14AmB]|uniref:DUF3987 domain-containing protein n=1 Tax=Desulfurivibrio sp. D14AmB TaxID=3374370 RepID=UPI00376EFCDC
MAPNATGPAPPSLESTGSRARKHETRKDVTTARPVLQAALALLGCGFSVIPTGPDKRPLGPWKRYQTTPMTEATARRAFTNGARLAVVAGKVSGGLECLDFDDPQAFEPYLATLGEVAPGLPGKLIKRRTPSGGFHLLYRSQAPVSGNLKLACKSDGQVRIESRGEGGYFLTAPSPGYEVLAGSLTDCPTLTADEVAAIHRVARAFDLRPTVSPEPETKNTPRQSTAPSPGDLFNQSHTVADILSAHGWKPDRPTSGGMGWTRPGKGGGCSGVLLETGNFYCWSSNASPLEPGKSYDPFGLFAAFNHNGEYSAAARELARQGYGEVSQKSQLSVSQWPEISPLVETEPAAPLPLQALPETIREAVNEVVNFVQCPVALGACCAIAAVSTVVQGLADVKRADKLTGPTGVYLLAVADSGERKSTIDGFFLKAIEQWEKEQQEYVRPLLREYTAALETWTAKRAGLLAAVKDRTKAGKDTGDLERQIVTLELAKPIQPKTPRLLFGSITPEALAYKLGTGWQVGAVNSSEAGVVFGGHGMSKDSAMNNMSTLNYLWDGRPLAIDRRTSDSFRVDGARLSMGLAVQPETVRAFLDSSKGLARGIGWLARFLIAWPESTQGERLFQDPPEHWPHLSKFHRRLGALLDTTPNFTDTGELSPLLLELSPEAKNLWVTFHDDVERELRPGRDMAETKDVASKAADNAARLAALFHVFEHGLSGTIAPEHMKAAAALTGWHLYEARRFFGEIAMPTSKSNAIRLEAWIVARCRQTGVEEVPTRDILRYGPPATRTADKLNPVLAELAEAGRLKVITENRQKVARIHPDILKD